MQKCPGTQDMGGHGRVGFWFWRRNKCIRTLTPVELHVSSFKKKKKKKLFLGGDNTAPVHRGSIQRNVVWGPGPKWVIAWDVAVSHMLRM